MRGEACTLALPRRMIIVLGRLGGGLSWRSMNCTPETGSNTDLVKDELIFFTTPHV